MPQRGKRHADHTILLALACGASPEVAARQAHVSERTVYRRLDDPEFIRRVEALQSEMLQRTAGTLTAAGAESVRTLLELQKPTAPYPTRLGAARATLEIGIRLREITSTEQRMAALERQLQGAEYRR